MGASPRRDKNRRQPTSETETATTDLARMSTVRGWAVALLARRAPYAQHSDQFSARELERLRFIRWLYQTGRLAA